MSYVVINLVFNDCKDGPYRNQIIIEKEKMENGLILNPKENKITFYNKKDPEPKSLIKVKEKDGNIQILSYVETIYVNDLKIFDYKDYDIKSYMVDGKKKYTFEDRTPIKLPVIL